MTTTKRGVLGFAAGLAIAIACSGPSATRSVDAGPSDGVADPTPVPDGARVRTAESDIDRQIDGTVAFLEFPKTGVVVEGPAVVTDVWATLPETFIYLSNDAQCESRVTRPHADLFKAPAVGHGMRLPVKAGEFLCLFANDRTNGSFVWSGYRPYAP